MSSSDYQLIGGQDPPPSRRKVSVAGVVLALASIFAIGVFCYGHSKQMVLGVSFLSSTGQNFLKSTGASYLASTDLKGNCNQVLVQGMYDRFVRQGKWRHLDSLASDAEGFDDQYSYAEYTHDWSLYHQTAHTSPQNAEFKLVENIFKVTTLHNDDREITKEQFEDAQFTIRSLKDFFKYQIVHDSTSFVDGISMDRLVRPSWAAMYEECLNLARQQVDLPVLDISPDSQVLDFSLRYSLGYGRIPGAAPRLINLYVGPPGVATCEYSGEGSLPLSMEPGKQYPFHCQRKADSTETAHVSVATDCGPLQVVLPGIVSAQPASDLWHRLRVAEERIKLNSKDIAGVAARINGTEEIVAELRTNVSDSIGQFDAKVHAMDEHIDAMSNLVAATSARVDTVTARVTAAEELLAEIDSLLSQTRANVSERLGWLDSRIHAVDDRVDGMSELIGATSERLDALTARVEETEELLAQTEGLLVETRANETAAIGQLASKLHALAVCVDGMSEVIGATSEKVDAVADLINGTKEPMRINVTSSDSINWLALKIRSLANRANEMSARIGAASEKVDILAAHANKTDELLAQTDGLLVDTRANTSRSIGRLDAEMHVVDDRDEAMSELIRATGEKVDAVDARTEATDELVAQIEGLVVKTHANETASIEQLASKLELLAERVNGTTGRIRESLKFGACGACYLNCGGLLPHLVVAWPRQFNWFRHGNHDSCGNPVPISTDSWRLCCMGSTSYS